MTWEHGNMGKQVVPSCIPQPPPLQQLHREWWRWVQRPPVSCKPAECSCDDSSYFPKNMGRLGHSAIVTDVTGQVTVTPVSPGICGKVVPSASMQSR